MIIIREIYRSRRKSITNAVFMVSSLLNIAMTHQFQPNGMCPCEYTIISSGYLEPLKPSISQTGILGLKNTYAALSKLPHRAPNVTARHLRLHPAAEEALLFLLATHI